MGNLEIKKELFSSNKKYEFIIQSINNGIRTQVLAPTGISTICEKCKSNITLFFTFSTCGGIQKFCPACGKQHFVKINGKTSNSKRKGESQWSWKVKENDNYKCHICGSTDGLNSHHIIPVCVDASLQYEESNGICLCKKCHDKVHSTDDWEKAKQRKG